jgi:leucyl/phenylalanyl-tRNA---protein transferase
LIYQLSNEHIFPSPELAEADGLLAVGGDLDEDRLLRAYTMGIFPWYSEDSPILWWSPDPRLVLVPEEIKVSRSLKKAIKKGVYDVTMDVDFAGVIKNCASVHTTKDGATWITDEMIDAYIHLYDLGFAHSVESWQNGKLVGGLYGIALGGAFFGESMFAKSSDASKFAFVKLVNQLIDWGFILIDCQIKTNHLITLGAKEIPRLEFISILKNALKIDNPYRKWVI